jgi:hypothetical protein
VGVQQENERWKAEKGKSMAGAEHAIVQSTTATSTNYLHEDWQLSLPALDFPWPWFGRWRFATRAAAEAARACCPTALACSPPQRNGGAGTGEPKYSIYTSTLSRFKSISYRFACFFAWSWRFRDLRKQKRAPSPLDLHAFCRLDDPAYRQEAKTPRSPRKEKQEKESPERSSPFLLGVLRVLALLALS